jgi:hypothetical protein
VNLRRDEPNSKVLNAFSHFREGWSQGKGGRIEPISKPVLDKYVLKTKLKVRNGDFKSPFFKGGFRGIIRPLFNPPCPPLEKGGDFSNLSSLG